MASDCPEPEVCRRCRKEGHMVAECPEPETCRRCRKEGHQVAECPEPEKCYNCRKVCSTLHLVVTNHTFVRKGMVPPTVQTPKFAGGARRAQGDGLPRSATGVERRAT